MRETSSIVLFIYFLEEEEEGEEGETRKDKRKVCGGVFFLFFSFLEKDYGERRCSIYIYNIPHNTMSISGFHSFDILIFRMPGGGG